MRSYRPRPLSIRLRRGPSPPPRKPRLWGRIWTCVITIALTGTLGKLATTGQIAQQAFRWAYAKALHGSVQRKAPDWLAEHPEDVACFVSNEVKQLAALGPAEWAEVLELDVAGARRCLNKEDMARARLRANILLDVGPGWWLSRRCRMALEVTAAEVSLALGDLTQAKQQAQRLLPTGAAWPRPRAAEEAWLWERAAAILAQVEFWRGNRLGGAGSDFWLRLTGVYASHCDTLAKANINAADPQTRAAARELAATAIPYYWLQRAQAHYNYGDFIAALKTATEAEKECRTARLDYTSSSSRLQDLMLQASLLRILAQLSSSHLLNEQEGAIASLKRCYEACQDHHGEAILSTADALCAVKQSKGSRSKAKVLNAVTRYRRAHAALEDAGLLTDLVWLLDEECCALSEVEDDWGFDAVTPTKANLALLDAIAIRCENRIAYGLARHDTAKLYEQRHWFAPALQQVAGAAETWRHSCLYHHQRLAYSLLLQGRIYNEQAAAAIASRQAGKAPRLLRLSGEALAASAAANAGPAPGGGTDRRGGQQRGIESRLFGIVIHEQEALQRVRTANWLDLHHQHALAAVQRASARGICSEITRTCKALLATIGPDPGGYYLPQLQASLKRAEALAPGPR